MDLHSIFSGKTIFFTGVTGFVGKVFLYLLLKNFPDLKRVYVLIRTKKGQAPQERFVKEVLSSQCFEPLIKEVGEVEFKRRCALVTAVSGDIVEDFLGINDKVAAEMHENVNFIAHLAATVDFQEKLNLSVQMNSLGALRVVSFAHKCRKLEAMVHTSTCYVNWARDGRSNPVKEQLYPLAFDPEAMCKHILSLNERFIPEETAKLLKQYNFPNTYTFTKSMAEHLIFKHKGKLPLVIVRPAIIGCSYRDPCPGWVDALTAAGGLFLTVGLGIVSEFLCHKGGVADVVPVDHVCSIIIKALYKVALHHKNQLTSPSNDKASLLISGKHPLAPLGNHSALVAAQSLPKPPESVAESSTTLPFVFHAATSWCLNNLTWQLCKEAILDFWNSGKLHPRAIGKSNVIITSSPPVYYSLFFFRRLLPFYLMKVGSQLPPPLGGDKKRKLVHKYERALARVKDLKFQFDPFVTKEWVFDQQNLKFLDENLTPKAHEAFPSDTFLINWWTYVQLYNYGMLKFIVKAAEGRSAPIVPRSGAEAFVKASL